MSPKTEEERTELVKTPYQEAVGSLMFACQFEDDCELRGYCDADWSSDLDDRYSVTGYVFKMQGVAVTWNGKKQPTDALSTIEMKYMVLSATLHEATWLKQLLQELDPDT